MNLNQKFYRYYHVTSFFPDQMMLAETPAITMGGASAYGGWQASNRPDQFSNFFDRWRSSPDRIPCQRWCLLQNPPTVSLLFFPRGKWGHPQPAPWFRKPHRHWLSRPRKSPFQKCIAHENESLIDRISLIRSAFFSSLSRIARNDLPKNRGSLLKFMLM